MSSDVNHDPYEAADAHLRAEEDRLSKALEAVRASRAAIAAARMRANIGPYAAPERAAAASTPISTPASTPLQTPEKFKGMGLGEAAAAQLAENKGLELTVKQLWAAMSGAGFTIVSERPEAALNWALRKRETKHSDVILIGDGKWGLADWYSPAQIKRFKESRTNASGRNHIEHVEKTKAGIANAMSSRLTKWGRRPSIKPEQMAKAYYARQSGQAKSKLGMARAGGIVYPTFLSYWCTYEMENWRPNDPLPPKRREVPKVNQDFKFENMWPPENGQTDLLNGNGIVVTTTTPH